jgi:methionyl-tRNA formyltransferase
MMVCVAGKNDIASNVLEYVAAAMGVANVVAVVNADDSGKHHWQKSLRKTASTLGVKEVLLADVYGIKDLIFLSVEFDKIIRPEKFQTTELFNIHFSLLPKYKGVYTAVWPLLNGEKEGGVTFHKITRGIDTGPIVDQVAFPIALADTARDLYAKCLALGTEVVKKNFEVVRTGEYATQPQAAIDSSYYALKSINFAAVDIDLNRTAYQIHNSVRAFSFYEYQLPIILGQRVWKSEILPAVSEVKPGTVTADTDAYFDLATIDYQLRLYKDYSKALFQAVEAGDEAAVAELAPRAHSLNLTNRAGWSMLMVAAYNNAGTIADILIQHGADVNQTNLNGTSVLMYAKNGALAEGDVRLLKRLLAAGADLRWQDATGRHVLDYAQDNGNAVVIDFFKEKFSK